MSDINLKPFNILGIQQIAIGGEDKERLKKLWIDLLGFQFKSTFVSERENVDEDICSIGTGVNEIEVDLMQPLDIEKKPAVHQTPLNHIVLWVCVLLQAVFVEEPVVLISLSYIPKPMMNFLLVVRVY